MCRALTVLCAAPDGKRLAALKRATVGAQWELRGGAVSVDELIAQIREHAPHVVVIEGLPADTAVRARAAGGPTARILVVSGATGGPDPQAQPEDDRLVRVRPEAIRDTILGLPAPGGPVRT